MRNHRRRIGLILVNFATISLAVASVGFWLSYRQQVKETMRLLESINTHASTFIFILKNNLGQKKTLKLLSDYHQNPRRFKTEEIILAKKSAQGIECVYSYRSGDPSCHFSFADSQLNPDWAKPMKLALAGEKGVQILKDYEGREVIAAYSSVPLYSWGLVHKIELGEVQAPFRKSWLIVTISSLLVNGIGVFLFFRLTPDTLLPSTDLVTYKKIQEDLIRDKEFITAVINNTDIFIVVTDSQQCIISVNSPCQDFFAVTLEIVQGKKFTEVFVPESPADSLGDLNSNYHDFSQIYLIDKKDSGSSIKYIIEWKKTLFINPYNKASYYVFNGVNTTEKYIYEQEIQASEYRFKAMFDKAAIAILEVDNKRQIIKANREAESLFYYPKNEIIGHFLDEYISPTDLAKESKLFAELATKNRSYYQIEVQYISQDKLKFWGQSVVSGIFHNNGQFDYAIVMIQDISSRRDAEREKAMLTEKNKNLVKALGEIVYSHNVVEDVVEWQGDIERILGYSTKDVKELATSMEQCMALIHPDDKPSVAAKFNLIKNDGDNLFQQEYRILTQSGQFLWVLDRGVAIFDQDNTLLKIQGVLTDITRRKKAEILLKEANSRLSLSLQELVDYNQDVLMLNECNEYLQTCSKTQEIYEVVPHFLKTLFPDCNGAIFKVDYDNDLVTNIVGWGEMLSEEVFSTNNCWGLRKNCVISYPNAGHFPRCSHLDHYVQASLCIPLVAMDKNRGLLVVTSDKNIEFTDNKKQIAIALAENVSLALNNLKLRETLEFQSIRDSLTGLYNRHYWEGFLTREIDYVQRSQRPLSIIMLDLDYFKQFNDSYGHIAGDELLVKVAKELQKTVRKTDVACRYGGEEFLIILPDTSLQKATEIAERIRVKISEIRLNLQGKMLSSATASFGVTECTDLETQSNLLARVDAALYRAKWEGRNRVIEA